ncbi:hypothetical protein [Paraburkholderia sp. HP33-1]|nr:hypothetical protein [Paraburkholderia sp. HP33-1]
MDQRSTSAQPRLAADGQRFMSEVWLNYAIFAALAAVFVGMVHHFIR